MTLLRRAAGRPRRLILLLILGVLVAAGVLGKVTQARPVTAYAAREFAWSGRVYCWPVAVSRSAQQRGLSGLRTPPPFPLVYLYPVPRVASFWMRGTRFPLTVVWLSPLMRVLGHWSAPAESLVSRSSPGVVSAVIELPRGWPVPSASARLVQLGPCGRLGAL